MSHLGDKSPPAEATRLYEYNIIRLCFISDTSAEILRRRRQSLMDIAIRRRREQRFQGENVYRELGIRRVRIIAYNCRRKDFSIVKRSLTFICFRT